MEGRPAETHGRRIGGDARQAPDIHLVHFYDDDDELVASVAEYLAAGLRVGEGAVVIAAPGHLRAIESALGDRVADLETVRRRGRLVLADAEETISAFAVDGKPDAERFARQIEPLLEAARGPVGVRAYGEMVALLWQEGKVEAALALEGLWNELGERFAFGLYCAYPAGLVANEDFRDELDGACRLHHEVIGRGSLAARTSTSRIFTPNARAVRAARRFARDAVGAREDLADAAGLVASELASNAVRHAGTAFSVTVAPIGDAVRISVRDASPRLPSPRAADVDDQGGRGLLIVASLSGSWGVAPRRDGKTVWAELRPPP